MWYCRQCQIEVEDNLDVCWSCGVSRDGSGASSFNPDVEGVMDEAVYQESHTPHPQDHLVAVAVCWLASEAQLLRAQLAAEGIRAMVPEELTLTGYHVGVKVFVAEKDVERAREVLAADTRAGSVSDGQEPEA